MRVKTHQAVVFWQRLRSLFADQGGFTMVEMVTILAIIGVLSALVIANTSVGDQRQRLRDAVAQFVTAAKSAETGANSSQLVNGSSRKAYGICVTTSAQASSKCNAAGPGQLLDTYQVYARTSTDQNYAVRPSAPDIITTYSLPRNVTFRADSATSWVEFRPPGPITSFNGSTSSSGNITIQTGTGNSAYNRSIQVNAAAGAVYAP